MNNGDFKGHVLLTLPLISTFAECRNALSTPFLSGLMVSKKWISHIFSYNCFVNREIILQKIYFFVILHPVTLTGYSKSLKKKLSEGPYELLMRFVLGNAIF